MITAGHLTPFAGGDAYDKKDDFDFTRVVRVERTQGIAFHTMGMEGGHVGARAGLGFAFEDDDQTAVKIYLCGQPNAFS